MHVRCFLKVFVAMGLLFNTYDFFACMCAPHAWCAWGGQTRASEAQTDVSCPVGAGNPAQVLPKAASVLRGSAITPAPELQFHVSA